MTDNDDGPTDRRTADGVQTGRDGPTTTGRYGDGRSTPDGPPTGPRTTCSREVKTGVEVVDPEAVLEGVDALTVSTWRYQGAEEIRHMSPMAEQFHATFGLGVDDEHIDAIDAGGVALAAIRGLSRRLDETRERLAALEDQLDADGHGHAIQEDTT